MGWSRFLGVTAGSALFAWGCASVSPRDSFHDVRGRTAQRGIAAPPWDEQTPESVATDQRVRALLARPLSPDAAVEVALLRNRGLQATYQSLGIAQADLVQAGLLKNPTLGASLGLPLGGAPHASLAGSITEDVLGVFLLPLRRRFASLELERARALVASAVVDLASDVRADFYRLQAFDKEVELGQTLLDAETAASELAQRQLQAGNVSELEAANRLGASEQLRLELLRAQAEALEAREALVRRMGLEGEEPAWTLEGSLPELPGTEGAVESLERVALRQRLDLSAAQTEEAAAQEAVHVAASSRFLTSSEVGVRAERDAEGNKVFGPTLSLELPLFDQHQAQLARLEAQARAARARREQLAIDIRSETRVAHHRLVTARQVAEHYLRVLLPVRRRILALSQQRYNGMLLGVYGLLQAKQNEVSAYRGYIEAVRDYWVARCALERALGGRLPPTAPALPPRSR